MKQPFVFVFLLMVLCSLLVTNSGLAQSPSNQESCPVPFEVRRVEPAFPITFEKITTANSLTDLNPRYPATWVRQYLSVEIQVRVKGKVSKAVGKDAALNSEQRKLMLAADPGSEIGVVVHYIPENNLKENEPRTIDFNLSLQPQKEAQFPGGYQNLKAFLEKNGLSGVPASAFQGYALAGVKFRVNERGQIGMPQIVWSSGDVKVDQLLVKTVQNMPDWEPAAFDSGEKVSQEFVLAVGNMESCALNLLKVRQD
ncbi:MAG: energy transducer TonB [Bacteroidia bacterium]|nr:energy transducer TonB [Bacteroidia bacterium]